MILAWEFSYILQTVCFKRKENKVLPKWVVCCCSAVPWGLQICCCLLQVAFSTFTMKTNEKPIKMRPGSEPCSQLESSILILVQGFSSTIRYDPSSHILSLLFLIKNNKEISPGSSRSSLLPFPYCFLLTIRKSLPGAPDPPSSLFLIVSY